MSEKDYRATYLTSLGIQCRKIEILDMHADDIDLDKIRNYLLVTPSSKLGGNRAQIWQFLLGIIPRYKTVRLHTQEQLDEQWAVVENAARLILSISSDHDTTQYFYALHLIQTGQLSLMNDSHEIACGDSESDKANVLLIKNILLLLKTQKFTEKYFIIHEILLLFSSINRNEVIVQKIISSILQRDSSLAEKLHSAKVRRVLSSLVRTCFVKALPPCCFGKLIDNIIAKRNAACLVGVGVEIVMKNGVINRSSSTNDLAEEIKTTILVTQPHQSCLSSIISKVWGGGLSLLLNRRGREEKVEEKKPKFPGEEKGELRSCCVCNKDAEVLCEECDNDLYCKPCFKEGHDEIDLEDHKPTIFKKTEQHRK